MLVDFFFVGLVGWVDNFYALNEDKPAFFQDFLNHPLDFECEDVILGVVFNLVLVTEKDKKGGLSKTHQNSLKVVKEFSQNLDLIDVLRNLNPDSSSFTWVVAIAY